MTETFAIIGAAALSGVVFFILGLSLAEGYKSKKTCRECLRRLSKNGFWSDGKDYICTEVAK